MDANERVALVLTRNDHYKKFYFMTLGIFALCLLAIAMLASTLIFVKHNPPHPVYFATDDVTHLIKVIPVNEPNMSLEEVVAWTKEAVEAAYSYDFINYRQQLQEAQKYFTPYGWGKFMEALKASNNLLSLPKYKYLIEAHVIGEPTLVAQAYLGGALAWKFEMPLLVTYAQPPYDGSANSQFSNPLTVTVIVQRQPILQSYKGLGIAQLIATWTQGA